MQAHSRYVKVAYGLAAIPAMLMPISYLVTTGWAIATIFPALLNGKEAPDASGLVLFVGHAGLYATFIQWPFYFFWAARTSRLTLRVRVLWIVVLFLFNMFAMPWFLFCMYRGTAQTALTRSLRRESVRRFFEKGPKQETHTT